MTPQTPAILDSSGSQAQKVSRYTPRRGSSPASAGAASARAITSSASGRVTSYARAPLPARAARFPNIPSRSLDAYMEALNG